MRSRWSSVCEARSGGSPANCSGRQAKRADAGGDDDAPRSEDVVAGGDLEPVRVPLDAADVALVQLRDGRPLEPAAVLDEPVDRDRDRNGEPAGALMAREREPATGISDVAPTVRRAQQHAGRRLRRQKRIGVPKTLVSIPAALRWAAAASP